MTVCTTKHNKNAFYQHSFLLPVESNNIIEQRLFVTTITVDLKFVTATHCHHDKFNNSIIALIFQS